MRTRPSEGWRPIFNLTSDASAIQVAARENATTSKSLSDLQYIINDRADLQDQRIFTVRHLYPEIDHLNPEVLSGTAARTWGSNRPRSMCSWARRCPPSWSKSGSSPILLSVSWIQDREYQTASSRASYPASTAI